MVANAVINAWPSGSANAGWPQEPSGMLLPGRVEGWPAGTQRAANSATRLLSQAVAWWDVEQYREGDRFLRNRGTGGELLDLRLGSSLAPNSNDPLYLAPEDRGYVYLPWNSNGLSVPDEAALDITGDIDVRLCVAMDDWTPSSARVLASKWAGQQSWWVQIETDGRLVWRWSTTGSDAIAVTSDAAVSAQDGEALWIRVTHDVDNGASGNDVTFFTSVDGGVTWTQLGNTRTSAGTTSIFSSTATVNVGGYFNHGAGVPPARIYRAQILNGIGGTTALDIDCDAITSGSATSFTAVTGQTVTISRSAADRKTVAVPSRHKGGRPVMLFGTDDYLECLENWQHGLLNFDAGQSFTVLAVVRRWATLTTHRIIWKSASGNTRPMYRLLGADATYAGRLELLDEISTATVNTPTGTTGDVAVHAFTVDRGSQRVTPYAGTAGTSVSIKTLGSLASRDASLRIGRDQGSNYADMELYAVAFWRRALSPDEITTLSNYFTGRIA